MRRAVGFDLGETLLTYAGTPPSWAPFYRSALERVAAASHAEPDEKALARAAEILAAHNTRLQPRTREISAEEIFAAVLAAWRTPVTAENLAAATAAFFGFFQQRLVSYPESLDVLVALRAAGDRIGVLTDVPYGMPRDLVKQDLRMAGLDSAVDRVLTSVDVGWRKPATPGFFALAAALGTPASALWYVGNEEKDIAGAQAAGATAVLIDRERRRPSWGQAHTIQDLRELIALLA